MFDELHDLKDENDELIDMFVTEKCFKDIKNKVCRKYKNKKPDIIKEECSPLCCASIVGAGSEITAIISGMTEIVY